MKGPLVPNLVLIRRRLNETRSSTERPDRAPRITRGEMS